MVRLRFRMSPSPEQLPQEQVARARHLMAMRARMTELLGHVEACASCSLRHPPSEELWSGGFCCAGPTEDLFVAHEVASIKAAGIDGMTLRPPRGVHAGCVFRGSTGCSLMPIQRPNRCARHMCSVLRCEIGLRGDLVAIERLGDEIEQTLAEFSRALVDQLDADEWRDTEARLRRDFAPAKPAVNERVTA